MGAAGSNGRRVESGVNIGRARRQTDGAQVLARGAPTRPGVLAGVGPPAAKKQPARAKLSPRLLG